MRLLSLVALVVCCALVAAEGKCKVTHVRAVCESRCEEDTRPADQSTVPPAGTLLPPTVASLLELESRAVPGVNIVKTKSGRFLPENIEQAVNQRPLPAELADMHSARLVFPDRDLANLNELSASHFEKLDVPSTLLFPPMTCDEVETHINPVPLMAWTNVRTASFGCADGRSAEEGLGTWGADFGEFITALNVYEQMATIHLSQADVTSIFRKYLEVSSRPKFTTCMSSLSLRQLFGAVEDLAAAIKTPPEEKRAPLWMKIADPNFIGNDHVKFMLESPTDYSVRKELVQHFIHAFFDILWNEYDPLRERLNVQVLPGDHQERALVSVTVPEFCLRQANLAPLIAPRLTATSIVIINPDAVQVLRKELSVFFSRDTSPVVRADELMKRFNVLAAGQGSITKKKMFDRIPSYTAKISE